MLVFEYLQWVRTATQQEQLCAAQTLAQALVAQELLAEEYEAIHSTLLVMCEEQNVPFRQILAQTLAPHENAPLPLILNLMQDVPEVASSILAYSPLLTDVELLNVLSNATDEVIYALSLRSSFSEKLLTRLVESANEEICAGFLLDKTLPLTPEMLTQLAQRFFVLHEALLERDGLPSEARYYISLTRLEKLQELLPKSRANKFLTQDKERIALSVSHHSSSQEALIHMINSQNNLTSALLLRALYCGNFALLEAALAYLSSVPLTKVAGILNEKRPQGLEALFTRANLPLAMFEAFKTGLMLWNEGAGGGRPLSSATLSSTLVNEALKRLHNTHEETLVILRGFSLEAAKDEARKYVQEAQTQTFEVPVTQVIDLIPLEQPLSYLEYYTREHNLSHSDSMQAKPAKEKTHSIASSLSFLEEFVKNDERDEYEPFDVPKAMNDDENLSLLERYTLEKVA